MADPQNSKPQNIAPTSDSQGGTHPQTPPPSSLPKVDLESIEELFETLKKQVTDYDEKLKKVTEDRIFGEEVLLDDKRKLAEIEDKTSQAYIDALKEMEAHQLEVNKTKEDELKLSEKLAGSTQEMQNIITSVNEQMGELGDTAQKYKNITVENIKTGQKSLKGITDAFRQANLVAAAKSGISGDISSNTLKSIHGVLKSTLSATVAGGMNQKQIDEERTKQYHELLSTEQGREEMMKSLLTSISDNIEESKKELESLENQAAKGFGSWEKNKEAQKKMDELKASIVEQTELSQQLTEDNKVDAKRTARIEMLIGKSVAVGEKQLVQSQRDAFESKLEKKADTPPWAKKALNFIGTAKDFLSDIRGYLGEGKAGFFKMFAILVTAYLGAVLGMLWARLMLFLSPFTKNFPAILRWLQGIQKVFMELKWVKSISTFVSTIATKLTPVISFLRTQATAIGSVLKSLGIFGGKVGAIGGTIAKIGAFLPTLGRVFAGAFKIFSGPIGWIIQAIFSIVDIFRAFKIFRGKGEGFFDSLTKALLVALIRFATFGLVDLKTVVKWVSKLGNYVFGIMSILSGPFRILLFFADFIKGFMATKGENLFIRIAKGLAVALIRFLSFGFLDFKKAMEWVNKAVEWLTMKVEKFADWLWSWIETLKTLPGKVIAYIMDMFKKIFSPNPGIIVKLIKALFVSLPMMILNGIWSVVKFLYVKLPSMILGAIWSGIKFIFGKIVDGLASLPVIGKFFRGGSSGSGGEGSKGEGGVMSRMKDALTSVVGKVKSIFSTLKPFIDKLLNLILAPVKAFSNGLTMIIRSWFAIGKEIVDFIKGIVKSVLGLYAKIYNFIFSAIGLVINTIKGFVFGVLNNFKSVFDKLLNSFNRVSNFMTDVVDLVMSKVKLILSKLWDALAGTAIGKFLGLNKGEMEGAGGTSIGGQVKEDKSAAVYSKVKSMYDSGQIANMDATGIAKVLANLVGAESGAKDDNMKQNIKTLKGNVLDIAKEKAIRVGKGMIKNLISGPASALSQAIQARESRTTAMTNQPISNTTVMNRSTNTTQVTPAASRYNSEPTVRGTQFQALPGAV